MSTQCLHNQRKSLTRQLATSAVAATSHTCTSRTSAGLDMYGVKRPTNAGNEGLGYEGLWALEAQVAIASPAFEVFAIILPADLNSQGVAT